MRFARLYVSRIAEDILLGDVNLDGVVDFFDIQPFVDRLTGRTYQFEADIDGNNLVNFFDISPFITDALGLSPGK